MKTRKLVQLLSLLLFPITLYYFSPYVIMMGLSERIVSGSFIVFFILMITSIFTGRLFCSSICPAGAVQDILIDRNFKPAKRKSLHFVKWIIFSIWIACMILIVIQFGSPNSIQPFYQTQHGVSIYQTTGYFIYYGVLGIFIILALIFGNRGGCHTLCWMAPFMVIGKKIGRLLKLPYYGLHAKDTCINCKKCEKVCPMSLSHEEITSNKSLDCISCKACVSVCPNKTLEIKWNR